ncbi:MAG: helix-turn-helix transcriptional regulator [Egibacteraceae bacterium]
MRSRLNLSMGPPSQATSQEVSQEVSKDAAEALVGLLGDSRAQIVDLLRTRRWSVAELASALGVSEVAVRRHLQGLERDGLIHGETLRTGGRGRPGTEYGLTDKGRRLFPDRSAQLAKDLLEFLETVHGRAALRTFLRWHAERQAERYGAALEECGDDPAERAERLARLLTEDGFLSDVEAVTTPEGATVLQLKQGHCTVREVAQSHPEICAYEAALFKRLLGTKVSRRQTIAGGAGECICHIS